MGGREKQKEQERKSVLASFVPYMLASDTWGAMSFFQRLLIQIISKHCLCTVITFHMVF